MDTNVRPGLIELYKNKIRYIGYTREELDQRHESKFLSEEEYQILDKFFNDYQKDNTI